jgi:4-hydroxy-2-oxoglutarate aldolase
MSQPVRGIFAPITTPFNGDGTVNYEHLISNMEKYAQTRLNGFLVLGSNGENKSLTINEKERVVKTVIGAKARGQKTMVGSIFESTMETIEFALMAEEAGADFITLLPPSYFKSAMKDPVLLNYFSAVASALKIPCLLYKAPQFSGGVDISLSLIQECAGHPNIIGVKDSSSGGIEKLLNSLPGDFSVLSGSANTFCMAMLQGATGGVLSLANYLPERAVELYDCLVNGDLQGAAKLNRRIVACNTGVSGSWGVAGVKAAMDSTGFYGGPPRLPLPPISPEGIAAVQKALAGMSEHNED